MRELDRRPINQVFDIEIEVDIYLDYLVALITFSLQTKSLKR